MDVLTDVNTPDPDNSDVEWIRNKQNWRQTQTMSKNNSKSRKNMIKITCFENKTILILDLILTFLLKLVVEKRKR